MKEYIDMQVQLNREWIQKYHEADIESLREAVRVANAANEKRFEGINEFRNQLKDQASTFITRSELWSWLIAVIGVVFAFINLRKTAVFNSSARSGRGEKLVEKVDEIHHETVKEK